MANGQLDPAFGGLKVCAAGDFLCASFREVSCGLVAQVLLGLLPQGFDFVQLFFNGTEDSLLFDQSGNGLFLPSFVVDEDFVEFELCAGTERGMVEVSLLFRCKLDFLT